MPHMNVKICTEWPKK